MSETTTMTATATRPSSLSPVAATQPDSAATASLWTPPPNERHFDPEASIVLVGCRGAGKRSLGFIGALHLRRRLITEDHYFQQVTGMTRAQFLARHGRQPFARRSAEVFRQMLDTNRKRCIIECGMSSLAEDAQAALRALCKTNPVVYVHREREHILRYLGDNEADADQLLRADESHRQCSNYEYYNLYDDHASNINRNGSAAGGGDVSMLNSNNHSTASSAQGSGANTPWDASHHHSSLLNNHILNHGSSTAAAGAAAATQPPTGAAGRTSSSSARLLYAKEDFTQFLDLLQGQAWRRQWSESPFSLNAIPPQFRAYSYAIRLRLSYLVDMDLAWEDFEAYGDCVELIIDHWPDDLFNLIARQVALIRRKLRVPILFHVEENPREERVRSLEERDLMDAALLALGLRLNVEYLSLDLQRTDALVASALARRGRANVVGNFWFHGLAQPSWEDDSHMQNYRRAQALGCGVVRMGRFCLGGYSPEALSLFKEQVATVVPDPKPPLVAYDFSLLGVRTPLQSRVLNPVKHPRAAPRRDHLAPVCTPTTAYQQLFTFGRLDTLQFYTIGSHIAYSITPAIVMAAFAFSGMPHSFQAAEISTLDELAKQFLAAPGGDPASVNATFGGATLAAPFKVAIRPHIQLQSQHAAAIGAVNVILPLRGVASGTHGTATVLDHANARNKAGACSAFYGDNTDWLSINKCLQRAISPRNSVQPSRTTALVVGAGGMARAAIYALIQLGCRHVFVYNRTREHALDVARHFDEWAESQGLHAPGCSSSGGSGSGSSLPNGVPPNHTSTASISSTTASSATATTTTPTAANSASPICHVLSSLDDPWPAAYQPPTIVVSCVPAIQTDGSPAAEFVVPRQWLGSPTGGVVVELAYEPLITPLVAQMQTVSPAWTIVDGLEVVSEMAIEAFELLTGRMAPRRLMRTVCQQTWDQQQQDRAAAALVSGTL